MGPWTTGPLAMAVWSLSLVRCRLGSFAGIAMMQPSVHMYHVCNELDNRQRLDKEAAMVKWYASEMAERVTSDCLQIFGGAGYTKLHAVERYWRDARLTKIFEGTSEIQLRIISDRILGRPTNRQKQS